MTWFRAIVAIIATLLLSGAADAQTGVFEVPVAMLVTEPAQGYGMYDPRPSNHFKVGETVRFYLEPKGFTYKEADKIFTFGISADLLLTRDKDVLFGKKDFLMQDFQSHVPNKELMLNGSLSISGASPGDYVIELLVRDNTSKASTKVQLPFTLD